MVRRTNKEPWETHPDDLPPACVIRGFPLIQFDRRPIDRDLLVGLALKWSTDITVIHVLENSQFQLNGYAVFRNSEVRRWRPIPRDEFYARAAVLNRVLPELPTGVKITSMKEAVSTAGKAFPLITIHRERIQRGVCEIGTFLRTTQRSVVLRPISPEAEWEEEETYLLRDITLLEFGGAYEQLLDRMSKPIERTLK